MDRLDSSGSTPERFLTPVIDDVHLTMSKQLVMRNGDVFEVREDLDTEEDDEE